MSTYELLEHMKKQHKNKKRRTKASKERHRSPDIHLDRPYDDTDDIDRKESPD